MPMAVPTIPDSAKGVSTIRSSPNLSWSPSVTRKTPPSRPTSSPRTTTLLSLSISSRRAKLIASTILSLDISSPFKKRDRVRVTCPALFKNFLQILHLFFQLRRHLRINIFKNLLQLRYWNCFGLFDCLINFLLSLFSHSLFNLITPEPSPFKIKPQPHQWVELFPGLDFILPSIFRRVIGCSMRTEPIGDRFNQCRSSSGTGFPYCFLCRCRDCKEVITIHLDSINPIANRLLGNRLRAGLGLSRTGAGQLVILAEEDARTFEDSCEVHRLMEIALGCCTVSEVGDSHGFIPFVLGCPGHSDRMKGMSPNGY